MLKYRLSAGPRAGLCLGLKSPWKTGLMQNATEASGSMPDWKMLQLRLNWQGWEFKHARALARQGELDHTSFACILEGKTWLWGRTDLPGAEFLSNPLLSFACYQNLSFHRSHLGVSVETIFVSQAISLRSKLFSVLLIQCVVWVRQTRLLDPHWGANLSSTQTMHIV